VQTASDALLNKFLDTINGAKRKLVTLKVTPPYAKDLVLVLSLPTYPTPIMELYNPVALHFPYHDLLCEAVLGGIRVCLLLANKYLIARFHQSK